MSKDDGGNISAYTPEQVQNTGQAAKHFGRGAAWLVTMRWATRLVGVVSTVVLARLLAPEDFGVMAIAMLAVALIEVLAQSGQHMALVRHAEDTRDLYDAAWTLSVIQGLLLSLLIAASAPLAATLFDEPRVRDVILVMALRPFLLGITNIGVVAFLKELNFGREFQFRILEKCIGFTATIGLAILLRSYWALVLGAIISGVGQVALSYWLHPFRPRFAVRRMREILTYSAHILTQSIMIFGTRKSDEFVVASVSGTGAVGNYAVAGNLASAPIEELVLPMVRALHSIYSRLADKAQALRETYLLVFGMVATIALPAAAGIALVAEDVVPVLLGEKWNAAIPIVRWLALMTGLSLLANTSENLLNAVGGERRVTGLSWFRLAVLLPAVIAAGMLAGVEEMALARCGVALVVLPFFVIAAARSTGCGPIDYLRTGWRPLLATGAMSVVLLWMDTAIDASNTVQLISQVVAGALVYPAVLLGSWALSGRPEGPEHYVVGLLTGRSKGTPIIEP